MVVSFMIVVPISLAGSLGWPSFGLPDNVGT